MAAWVAVWAAIAVAGTCEHPVPSRPATIVIHRPTPKTRARDREPNGRRARIHSRNGQIRDSDTVPPGMTRARREAGNEIPPCTSRFITSKAATDLVVRGLGGVTLVTSDAHAGLVQAIVANLPGTVWQRCARCVSRTAGSGVGRAIG